MASAPAPGPAAGDAAAARPTVTVTPRSGAIVAANLRKTYPNGTQALRGVSFVVRPGELYGLVGPNGAGKSTLIGILGTLVRATGGRAFVAGLDVARDRRGVKARIGFAMQEAGVDDLATGTEFLVLQGRLQGLSKDAAASRARALLRLVGLEEAASKRIKGYSGGMKRRIDLASALIHRPPILFLDEPTEGLDPRSRMTMWNLLQRLNREYRTTIVLSTHYMEEADRLCHRIGVIDQGRLVAEGTPDELKAGLGGDSVRVEFPPDAANGSAARAKKALEAAAGVLRVAAADGGELTVFVKDARAAGADVLRILDRAGVPPAKVTMHRPTLDDVYLQLTGRTLARAEEAARGAAGAARRRGAKP